MNNKAAVIPTRESVSLDTGTASRLTMILGAIGVLGLGASAYGYTVDSGQFFHSYLVAFMFCLSLGLGALFFTILQHLVGAHWSVVVRRIAEVLMGNLWILAILFIPVWLGLDHLYHWTDTTVMASDAALRQKSAYLNKSFFAVRLVIYFIAWIGIGQYFYRKSLLVESTGDLENVRLMRRYSGICIPIYALTQTFAAFDLLMSLDAHWYSTIFGVYYFAGTTVTAFSALALISLLLRWSGRLKEDITFEHYHDLGKLMFGFTVFWAYIAFSQYFLIWYGNIPEETEFFSHRWVGSWKTVSLLMLMGRFVIPFAVLMSKHVKRTLPVMGLMAAFVIFMQLVDMQWLILPSLHHEGFQLSWMDITCLLGVVGIYGAGVVRGLGKSALLPIHDPLLLRSLEFENV